MNSFDITLLVIIAVFAVRGVFRGLITELTVLIALITGYVLAFLYLDHGVYILQKYFPALPEFASKIIAFAIIFVLVNIALRMVAKGLNKFASFTFMQSVNKSAGGIFAAAKAILFISIAFLVLEFIPFSTQIKQAAGASESSLYDPVRAFAPAVYRTITSIFPDHLQIQQKLEQTMQKADSTAKEYIPPIY